MQLRWVCIVGLAACAGRYRTEVVGVATGTGGIALARGQYDFDLAFDMPRAEVVAWHVECAGATADGHVGETFEAYRTRRIAELRAERDRERRAVAAVVGAVVPAAHAQVTTPNATVDATVAPGQAVAAAAVEDVIELPPGDIGAGRATARVHVATTGDGACTLATDDPMIAASFRVTRVRDLDAEARERMMAANTAAASVRVAVRGQLVDLGADPEARAKRLRAEAEARARIEAEQAAERARIEAERARIAGEQAAVRARIDAEHAAARARIEAEQAAERARIEEERAAVRVRMEAQQAEARARVEAELRAKAEIEVRRREMVMEVRGRLEAWLVICGADPGLRARLAAQARAEREAHARIEIELRLERERREQIALQARLERERQEREVRERRARELEERRQRDLGLALATRAQLAAYLVTLGARERPPMPAAISESPGAAPFPSARWTAGRWRWSGIEWTWDAGYWSDPTVFGATGGDVVVTAPAPPVVVTTSAPPVVVTTPSLPISVTIDPPRPPVVDHRAPPPPPPATTTVRDHRKP